MRSALCLVVAGIFVAGITAASACLGPRVKGPPRVAIEARGNGATKRTHPAFRIVGKPESLSPTESLFSTKGDAPATHRTLYVNTAGGTFMEGDDDSSNNVASVVDKKATVPPYEKGPAKRAQTVACIRKMFSRWNLTVTDADPGQAPHLEVVLGGSPSALGLDEGVGGVAPMYGDCSPVERGVTFVFSKILESSQEECEVVAQEVGHSLGLDHEYLCQDPMTYLEGCGAKAYRDVDASCGEENPRTCVCGGARQNSVRTLDARLGLATTAPPIALPPPVTTASTPPTSTTTKPPKPPTPPDPPVSTAASAPKIEPLLPPAGTRLPEGAIVVVSARVQDDVKIASVSLLWTASGKVAEIDCAAPPKDVKCTALFDTYTFELPAGKGVRVWSIRAVNAAGKQSVSPERVLTLGGGDTDAPPPVAKGNAITVITPELGAVFRFGATIPVRATIIGAAEAVQIIWSTPNGDEIQSLEKLADGNTWGVDLAVPQLTFPGPRILTVRVASGGVVTSAPPRFVTIIP